MGSFKFLQVLHVTCEFFDFMPFLLDSGGFIIRVYVKVVNFSVKLVLF